MQHLDEKEIEQIVESNLDKIVEPINTIATLISEIVISNDTCHHGVQYALEIITEHILDRVMEIIPETRKEEYATMFDLELLFRSGVLGDDDNNHNIIHIYS